MADIGCGNANRRNRQLFYVVIFFEHVLLCFCEDFSTIYAIFLS